MGCCASAKNTSSSFLYCKKLQEAIERNNIKALNEIHKTFSHEESKTMIDEPFITIHELNMSPLAYALWVGRLNAFLHLHKKMGASLVAMENLFIQQGKTPLEILCLNGNLEVLQYYLPVFLSCAHPEIVPPADESVSVDFQKSTLVETKLNHTYTPIHLACEHGNIHIIDFVFKYFKGKPIIPQILDLDFQDESSGENCALIACRKGNYPMVKFLNEVCGANFRVLNKRYENAVLITAAASKRRPTHNYYDVFVYLIDAVKLDITYMHEEVMLLLEDRTMIRFFESKLQRKGITSLKNTVEKKYEISRPNIPISKEELIIEEQGENFQLRKAIDDFDDNTQSVLSSIQPEDFRPITPFLSTITLDGK
ncbi:hypothetical protein SteCoe_529 [Stentor coeruleus]|uniref:Uncharacterized protein n=1 Tax=Stentor coeruleus TaxID=5963 RepID=A0A1R2D426_9CILI|nr:hypothetical protein SteCoe_529 [Stentor coeruleus]